MQTSRRLTVLVTLLFTGATLSACATTGQNYRPIIDTKGVQASKLEADLRDCQSFAAQSANAAQSAAAGAVAGALLGALLAAAAGSNYSRNQSARLGAVYGAVGAGADGETDQRNIIRRCMTGRGYTVLQ